MLRSKVNKSKTTSHNQTSAPTYTGCYCHGQRKRSHLFHSAPRGRCKISSNQRMVRHLFGQELPLWSLSCNSRRTKRDKPVAKPACFNEIFEERTKIIRFATSRNRIMTSKKKIGLDPTRIKRSMPTSQTRTGLTAYTSPTLTEASTSPRHCIVFQTPCPTAHHLASVLQTTYPLLAVRISHHWGELQHGAAVALDPSLRSITKTLQPANKFIAAGFQTRSSSSALSFGQ